MLKNLKIGIPFYAIVIAIVAFVAAVLPDAIRQHESQSIRSRVDAQRSKELDWVSKNGKFENGEWTLPDGSVADRPPWDDSAQR